MVFTVQQTLEALNEVVEEKGSDFVYRPSGDDGTCSYATPEGAPSCIVGHVFARLTPDIFQTIAEKEWANHAPDDFIYATEADVKSVDGTYGTDIEDRFDESSIVLLVEAQNKQDANHPWGEAVEAAIARLEEFEAAIDD